ncbi:hypothetical protein Nmel_012186 [Mimus melanotis]
MPKEQKLPNMSHQITEQLTGQNHLILSALQKEMSLTIKQRLASTKKLNLPQIFSAAGLDHRSLQPCPAEVVFQNYSSGEVCEMPVVLRNRDKVPHLVKVILESSPYFQLEMPNDAHRKVPPGLSVTVRIIFTPGQNKLDFSQCPVKYSSQKTLLVRNLGNRAAHYQLSTQSPFCVTPAMGTLGIGDSMQVTVGFLPLKTGGHSASLTVHYDTGEDTHTNLHGRAVDVHIRLDRNAVTFGKTYITRSNHTTVLIHNLSNITAHFQWKAVDTQEKEDQMKLRQYPRLYQQDKDKLSDFLKENRVDTTPREYSALLTHTLQRVRAKVQEDPMLFYDDIFCLEPKEGEIWPSCSAEISVFFKPQEARVYNQAVYCDISGRETRLPLLLIGEGVGPRLHFRFEELNIGEVFIRATHRYEMILFNKGPLEAPFSLLPPTTAMGSCFTFLPQKGIVVPDRFQPIHISFCPTILGEFQEEFCFHVTGSPKPVTLTIRGCVMGPTFHFDVPALHFGDVSFGFPCTLRCCLSNTSLAPMAFNLCIPEDGLGEPSICSSVQIFKITHPSWRKGAQGSMKPREFKISPRRGTVHALGSQDIEVTLCSNTVREYQLELVVDVDGVGKKLLALPLTARCIVPALRVLSPVVTFGHCCLKFPYTQKVTLVNDSDFPGCYHVLPQEDKEQATAWYSAPEPSGIIEAHSSLEIPITLEAQQLGECSVTAEVAVFGREGSPLEIHLECIGQGPDVYIYPMEINFGTIPVLQDSSKTLQLSNQTDIPAPFWIELAGKCSQWRIEPSKGVVLPMSEVCVIVTANLDDTKKFQDKVKVFVENGHTTIISFQAEGIGTTIVTDKPLAPKFDFKPHFSFTPCRYQFRMTNQGRRIHRLFWVTEGFSIFWRSTRPPALRGTKCKDVSQSPRPHSPVFKLQPLMMDLRPGQTAEMVLEGCSSTAQEVKERLLCYATVGKETAKKQIMQVDVTCKFILPVKPSDVLALQYQPLSLKNICPLPFSIVLNLEQPFSICNVDQQPLAADSKKPSDVLALQYQPLSLKNICPLPFSIVLNLEQPFSICNVDQQPLAADSKPMMLDVGEELHLYIQFDPAYEKDLNSRVAERVLRIRFMEHPHEEQITVRGEVYFPNLHLQAQAVDFGCIINRTEQELHMEMTNCGPIPAQYHWSFLTDSYVNTIRFKPSPPDSKLQASKKKGRFPRRHSKIESVEELTETPETIQSSAQQPADAEDSLEAGQDFAKCLFLHARKRAFFLLACLVNISTLVWEVAPCSASWGTEAAQEAINKKDVLSSTAVERQRLVRKRGLGRISKVNHSKPSMQEVFDVQPLWGELQPGESQLVTFTFFGHTNIVARVTALCHVEGGPTYEVVVTGEASCPSYQLDVEEIDWGLQVFNKVLKAKVALRNTGVLEFIYVVPNPSTGTAAKPLPGVPLVLPTTGSIAPGKEQVLKVYYLPGKPGVFCRTFQIQEMKKYEKILKERGQNMGIHIKGNAPSFPLDIMDWEEILQEEEENPKEVERQSDESSYLLPSVVMGSSKKSLMESSKDESVTPAPPVGRCQLSHVS